MKGRRHINSYLVASLVGVSLVPIWFIVGNGQWHYVYIPIHSAVGFVAVAVLRCDPVPVYVGGAIATALASNKCSMLRFFLSCPDVFNDQVIVVTMTGMLLLLAVCLPLLIGGWIAERLRLAIVRS